MPTANGPPLITTNCKNTLINIQAKTLLKSNTFVTLNVVFGSSFAKWWFLYKQHLCRLKLISINGVTTAKDRFENNQIGNSFAQNSRLTKYLRNLTKRFQCIAKIFTHRQSLKSLFQKFAICCYLLLLSGRLGPFFCRFQLSEWMR